MLVTLTTKAFPLGEGGRPKAGGWIAAKRLKKSDIRSLTVWRLQQSDTIHQKRSPLEKGDGQKPGDG